MEAEVKHFFYEAKPKNVHDSWQDREGFHQGTVLTFDFPNEIEDENEEADKVEPPDSLALKLFKLHSEL